MIELHKPLIHSIFCSCTCTLCFLPLTDRSGLLLSFSLSLCCLSLCVSAIVQVGNIGSGGLLYSKTVTVDADMCGCPSRVDNTNWEGGFTYVDWFKVIRPSPTSIKVTRRDTESRWSMDLHFRCNAANN